MEKYPQKADLVKNDPNKFSDVEYFLANKDKKVEKKTEKKK